LYPGKGRSTRAEKCKEVPKSREEHQGSKDVRAGRFGRKTPVSAPPLFAQMTFFVILTFYSFALAENVSSSDGIWFRLKLDEIVFRQIKKNI
jgi:hypothetical protein